MAMLVDDNAPVGFKLAVEADKRFNAFRAKFEPHFIWLQEVIIEAKRAFAVYV